MWARWASFLHFLAYYILGRCLFRSPSLAALLSILMSIAVHWSFGTFWGSMRSDPVPRIFYADLWPFLLLLACAAVKRPSLQPVVMFLSGCAMLVHTVSALMGGAMFFMAFFPALAGQGTVAPRGPEPAESVELRSSRCYISESFSCGYTSTAGRVCRAFCRGARPALQQGLA